MQIKKAAEAVNSGAPTAVQLEAINAQAKAQLTAEQVNEGDVIVDILTHKVSPVGKPFFFCGHVARLGGAHEESSFRSLLK